MGVVTVNFQGIVCHAIADSPAIQRALVPNGEHVEGLPPHRAKLFLKKSEVDATSLNGLNPQTLGDYYFVYVVGNEVGIENLSDKATTKEPTFKDYAPHLKEAVPVMTLNPTLYGTTPDATVLAAYMELSGKLSACKTKEKAKFITNERRNFAQVVTMTTKTNDTNPTLFVRAFGATAHHAIRLTVPKPTVYLTNEPEPNPSHPHDADESHFLLQYRLAALMPINPPVPYDPGPEERVSCPRAPTALKKNKRLMYNEKPACSNASFP